MARDNKLDEYREAVSRAQEHRQNAGELFAEHAREKDETRQESLLSHAKHENELADQYEKTASELLEHDESDHTLGQEQTEQGDPTDFGSKRAWFEPGSVADDVLLQFEEANQGSLIGNVLEYAGRSMFDKEHRAFEGAKMLKSLASAPMKAAGAAYRGARSVNQSLQGREQSSHDRNPGLEERDPVRDDERLESTERTQENSDRDSRAPESEAKTQDRPKEQEHDIGER